MGAGREPDTGGAESDARRTNVRLTPEPRSWAPRAFVVLLNFNGSSDTLHCLRSLEPLDYPRCEVVVVENGSTDDSEARLRAAYPQLTILRTNVNLGFAGGCNLGIGHAISRGADYVWLLNNDTEVAPDALEALVDVAQRSGNVGAVGSVLYDFTERDRVQMWGGGKIDLVRGLCLPFFAPVEDHEVEFVSGASLLLSVPALLEVGGLNERYFMYWEDTDLGFRLRKSGWSLAVAQQSRVFYKEAATTGTENPVYAYFFDRSAVRFFVSHADRPIVPIALRARSRMRGQFTGRRWKHLAASVKGFGEGIRNALFEGAATPRRFSETIRRDDPQ